MEIENLLCLLGRRVADRFSGEYAISAVSEFIISSELSRSAWDLVIEVSSPPVSICNRNIDIYKAFIKILLRELVLKLEVK